MSTLLIEGGSRLSGSVEVEGNKNAALPLLAACLLTAEECVLSNVPRISDVEVMARLLLDLGAEVEGIGSTTLKVRCPEVVKDEPDGALVGRITSSAYGHTLGRSVGMGYVAHPDGVDAAFVRAGRWELELATERFAARAHLEPPYDPTSARVRA